ncbi:cytochrome P450 [Streptomyces massasporeus]|uniref:cytochrome P450 n=1 Tax=Streptomyces massasporeus TaxID=67324 RepID=UPI0037B9648D
MLSPSFTSRSIRQMRPRIDAIIAGVLDDLESGGAPADLVTEFAAPIPALVICELLGVPAEDRAEIRQRSNTQFDATLDMQTRDAAESESMAYMAQLVAEQRAHPGKGLIGTLIREHGHELSDRELTGIGALMLHGGHETTTHMLSLGVLFLLEHPEHAAKVRAADQIDSYIEELLRYMSVVQSSAVRVARVDTQLAGRRIRRGQPILCSLPAANHDPVFAAEAHRFDPGRRLSHLAFGHGIHYCIGAPLARLEMRVAYPELLRRFPGLRVAIPSSEVRFRPSSVFYGLQDLPVSW